MDLKLNGKSALVTGGSRGLGYAIAAELARAGAQVALLARDADTIEASAGRLSAAGHEAIGVAADTAQHRQVESAVAAVTRQFGGVDMLVNGAAKAAAGPPRNGAVARGVTEAQIAEELAADVSVGRLIRPSEVAHVVTFLASPLSVAINGDAVAAGGGLSGPIFY